MTQVKLIENLTELDLQLEWLVHAKRIEKLLSELVGILNPRTSVQTIMPEILEPTQDGK